MGLFDEISFTKKKSDEGNSLFVPWEAPSVISSNCPRHVGVKLESLGDNHFQCPKGKEIYKSPGSVSNQPSRDRYDLGLAF